MEIPIAKYRNQPGMNAITEKMEKLDDPTFGYDFTSYEETVKRVSNLKSRKVSSSKDCQGKYRYCFLFPAS